MLNINTYLRYLHIETSEDGQVGMSQVNEKGKQLRWTNDAAWSLLPDGKEIRLLLVVPSARRSRWRYSEHFCRSGHYTLHLNPVTWAEMKHRGSAILV